MIKICHWEITKKCNLNCIHCIAWKRKRRELRNKQRLKIIENLKLLGCQEIYLTGGEPLAEKDIFAVLKYAKNKKFKIGLLTNGTLINKKNIKRLKKYIDTIGVSLDGSNSTINDQIRGYGTFKKIIRSLLLIKRNKIPVSIYTTINQINISDLPKIFQLSKQLAIPNLRLNQLSLRGKAYKNSLVLKLDHKNRLNLENYILFCYKEIFSADTNQDLFIENQCTANPETIFLSSTGYIYPCVEIFQRDPFLHFGNILSLKDPQKFFSDYSLLFKKIKKEKNCPYKTIRINNISLCLNNKLQKCVLYNYLCKK